ncbi:MAG: NUDIX hydrolase, partial [Spirochaetota bacterium]
AVTVDCVVFGLDDTEGELSVLLIERGEEPFEGAWALPGGFVQIDEDLESAARRELEEETSVRDLYLEQLAAFGAPDRDPRERVITVAYFAIVNLFEHPVAAQTDARNAGWFTVSDLPALAFDHGAILELALGRLRSKVRSEPLVFEFLPETFTLRHVQNLYETILGEELDRRNFRKKIQSTGLLVPTNEVEMDVAHRAAQLFRFDREGYEARREEGFEWIV